MIVMFLVTTTGANSKTLSSHIPLFIGFRELVVEVGKGERCNVMQQDGSPELERVLCLLQLVVTTGMPS